MTDIAKVRERGKAKGKGLEYRATFEVRATQTDDGAEVEGYVAVFNVADNHISAFAPGAFTKTISERGERIPLLYQHRPELNIGVPVEHAIDARGLRVKARIFDDGAEGSTLSARLRQGARYGFSFGFMTLADRMANETDLIDLSQVEDEYNGITVHDIRYVTEVKVMEHSIVTFPSNESAAIDSIRQTIEFDAITSLMESVRDGTLSEEQRARLDELVAAYGEAPRSEDSDTPQEPVLAQRRLDIDIALATYGVLLETA